jgi:hypothetical protein
MDVQASLVPSDALSLECLAMVEKLLMALSKPGVNLLSYSVIEKL